MQIRKNRSAILLIIYILFAVYVFVFGDSGILERMKLEKQKAEIKERIGELSRENKKLEKDYSVISNKETNRNFYKGEAEKNGYIAQGEKYIFFQGQNKNISADAKTPPAESKYPVDISHLRILWIAVSGIILFFYFVKRRGKSGEENLSE